MKQMQELEKRMLESKQLTSNWAETRNDDDLLLANTFLNSKKPEMSTGVVKKNCRKKVTWD